MSIALTVIAETPTTLTVGWQRVAGAVGYEFLVDGKRVSNTWDGTATQVKFGKPDANEHTYSVVALAKQDQGDLLWPAVTPPPPTGFATLPQGPLKKSAPLSYRSAANPVAVASLDIENVPGQVDGLLIMQWPPVLSSGPYTVTDIVTQNIGNVPPTSNGTSEAGIWLGQKVNADRLVCDGSWEGLWTGAMCADSVIQNFTCGKADGKGGYTKAVNHIGAYCEHFSRRTLYKNFEIVSTDNGINIEWWYADSTYAPFVAKEYPQAMAGKAGSCELTFDTGRIYCPAGRTGIFADAGTWGCVFKNLTFWGPGDAIGLPNHLAGPTDNTVDLASCTFQNGGRQVYKHNNAIG